MDVVVVREIDFSQSDEMDGDIIEITDSDSDLHLRGNWGKEVEDIVEYKWNIP